MMYSDLDWEDVRVLEIMKAEGGEALTSETREHVYFEKDVLECTKSLVDEELIEFVGEVEERTGQIPTHQYRITDEGWEAISQGLTERVRPTVPSRQFDELRSRLDRIEDEIEQTDYDELCSDITALEKDMDSVKRDVQKRVREDQIETLSEELESVNDDLDILFHRVKDKATEEDLESVRATVENNERFNTILKEWAFTAAERDPDPVEPYNEMKHLIALVVALEEYLHAQGINIWAYHPSNADEEEEDE